jgi:microcystin-dependent protein
MEPFLGQLMAVGFNFAPRGWAQCNGQLLSIAQNTALFSLLGTTYGGDGRTTFGLPDLRGRVLLGMGQGPGLSNYTQGQKAGVESVTLTTNEIPAHAHPATAAVTVDVKLNAGLDDVLVDSAVGNVLATETRAAGDVPNIYTAGANVGQMRADAATATATGTVTVNPAGGSQPHSNMQPYLGIYYIIATQGIFPSRQ